MEERRIGHGYGHDGDSRPLGDGGEVGPLAYGLRRHRRPYGKSGISQRALALVAHVSRQFVERLETSTRLQESVEAVLRVSLALGHPVEEILSPERYGALRAEVERRRRLLGGDADPAPLPPTAPGVRTGISLAVTYRSPHLVTAVSDGVTVLELRQRRVSPRSSASRLGELVAREARTYGVREVVVESGTKVAEYARSLGIPHRSLTFDAAKRHVAKSSEPERLTDGEFFRSLLEAHPEFGRYVKVLPSTGRVAMSERWRTSRLVGATLALAAPIATAPAASSPSDGRAGCLRP